MREAANVLECVVNVSEGKDEALLGRLSDAAGRHLLDVHRDVHHNRSVFTFGGEGEELIESVKRLTVTAVQNINLDSHEGVHPRMGAVDVVPWIPLEGWPLRDSDRLEQAMSARDQFAHWAAEELNIPVFLYGQSRGLPDVRKWAWTAVKPDFGPLKPHPTAGAVTVGVRRLLVAYNIWLAGNDLSVAKVAAATVRGPYVRALGLPVGDQVQVSCNLIDPFRVGPARVWDMVAKRAEPQRAELVGLAPLSVVNATPVRRREELDLDSDKTIEARLERVGLVSSNDWVE